MSEAHAASSAEPPMPSSLRALETALRLLHAAGDAVAEQPATQADLRPTAAHLARAIEAVLDAYDGRRDAVTAAFDAMTAIDEAQQATRAAASLAPSLERLVSWLEGARGWVAAAADALTIAPLPRAKARQVQVARGVARAFAIPRNTLVPRFAVADPLPASPPARAPGPEVTASSAAERIAETRRRAIAQREEAEQRRTSRERARAARRAAQATPDARPGFVGGPLVAVTRGDFVARRARELFEEVTTAGLQRRGQLGEAWRTIDVLDQRMMRAVDALAVLGDEALRGIERLVRDAPAKVPALGFAIAFTLGAFEGRDALAAIERTVRWLDPDAPGVRAAVAEGLVLAPHPDLGPWLRAWLDDAQPGLRAIAIDVLGHRQLASPADFERGLADPDPRVVAAALVRAARGPEPARLLARHAIELLRGTTDLELVTASCWANVLGGFAGAAEEVESFLGGPFEGAALVPLAIACDLEQAQRLLERVSNEPTPQRVEALGLVGLGASLDVLVAVLDDPGSSAELRQAAAFALQRITGHEAYDLVDVPPERLDAEAPPDPENLPPRKEPLARKVSDPRDVPGDGAPDRLKLPSTQPWSWEDHLAREERRYASTVRFRRGQPFTPSIVLGELDHFAMTPSERRTAFAELVIKTGDHVPFDPIDFVPVQERAIALWGPIAHKASSQPGTWGRPRRR